MTDHAYGSFEGVNPNFDKLFPEGIYQEAMLDFANPSETDANGIIQRLALKFINPKDEAEVVWMSQFPTKKSKRGPDLMYMRETIPLMAQLCGIPCGSLTQVPL